MDDLVEWLTAQLDDDERVARQLIASPGGFYLDAETEQTDLMAVGGHVFRWSPARVLRQVERDRRILAEHAPEWQTVEWPHDQNGRGEAPVCRRCQNAEHTKWSPPVGQAGVLPEGFVTPYVLAPCQTLRLLALSCADRPGYHDEWRPEATA